MATREAYALLELKQWGETRTNSRSCQGGCSLIWRVGGVQGRRKAGILMATREAYALLELKQWGETRTNSRSCQGGCSLIWRVSPLGR